MSLPGNEKMRKSSAQTTPQMALVTVGVCAFAKSQFFASSSNELFYVPFLSSWLLSKRYSRQLTSNSTRPHSFIKLRTRHTSEIFWTYTFSHKILWPLDFTKSLDHHRTDSVKANLRNGPSWTWHFGVLPHPRGWEGRLHAGTALRPWFQQKGWKGHTIGVNEIKSHFEESFLEM